MGRQGCQGSDPDIRRQLKADGKLFKTERIEHDYPFCWRCDTPLLYYAKDSWFVRTTEFKDQMVANNQQITWYPDHIKDGRFGNWLENIKDWALSRERYWGTPLPIWVCDSCGHQHAVGSIAELNGMAVNPDPEIELHRPYVDKIELTCPVCGGVMHRVPEVIDVWFDSGSMPYAQWHYPFENQDEFAKMYPADFISEGIDQTRGWFYTLHAISTALNNTPAFKRCMVLELILDEKGHKMSKHLGNVIDPWTILDKQGADAFRWSLYTSSPPWYPRRFGPSVVADALKNFISPLRNVYSFFVIYANIDSFDPAASMPGDAGQLNAAALSRGRGYRPVSERSELDRWILSELNRTAAAVIERMDVYDNYTACARLTEFVDALSNWYVRRSRDRFWAAGQSDDKTDAYWTLYECLVTTARLIAPFVPFLAEGMWQNLAVAVFGEGRVLESVHLADYPAPDAAAVDEELSARMALAREIVSLGRSARMGAKLKVRQPLSLVEVVLVDPSRQAWLEEHAALIREELNVKNVEFASKADQYINYTVLPDLKRLGPRLGKRLPALRKCLSQIDPAQLLGDLEAQKKASLDLPDGPVVLDVDDIQVRLQAKPGWAAAQGRACVVVLSTELSEPLILEGLARELVHAVQSRRKDMDCQYTDRIVVGVVTDSAPIRAAIEANLEYLMSETLAVEIQAGPLPGVDAVTLDLGGHQVTFCVKVASGRG